MTGYGRAAGENQTFRVAVSARSVNHRFLDLVIRLAEDYRDVEPAVRRALDAVLYRGRVEIKILIDPVGEGSATVVVDREVARAIQAAAADLNGEVGGGLATSDLLRMPDVVRVVRRSLELAPEDKGLVLKVVGKALDELVVMREGEGAQLATILADRLATLSDLAQRLAGERKTVRGQLHDNMRRRLAELLDEVQVDEERLNQEVALMAEKMDVQEELDRLAAHLETFSKALAESGSIGRRLDFLAQEIHRELNTLGSKCRDSTMAQWVVDSKLACEQLREQVQNVE